ncbi:phage baseplate assembly protein V [Bradyrhizobium sp. Arg816]|uniref:phage baseplate assembly protein V n=1 Tax=Bradyrhizobium sp. Arg816 TaxID=2998491 RepID=UPI00249EC0D1|nr:phage baseplate assembly protein V [Bradyrhizobium sp. Arg816]MDI3560165.1 phage baseplate assembly protein V [Bradyrhizobium sp. Arg816]
MSETSGDSGKYYGVYQGTVTFNADPTFCGRLLLNVPDVLAFVPSTWAEPCTLLSGPTGPPMGVFMVPPVGAGVWVQFEQGDPDKPIWLGCRWGSTADIPPTAKLGNPADPNIVIQSLLQHSLMVSDMPPTPATGGIVLKSATGAMIVVNDSGIYINNGKGAIITLIGKAIDFNTGAMTIT